MAMVRKDGKVFGVLEISCQEHGKEMKTSLIPIVTRFEKKEWKSTYNNFLIKFINFVEVTVELYFAYNHGEAF